MFIRCCIVLILVLPFLLLALTLGTTDVVTDAFVSPVILIDPGHGGEDGGTMAADGTLEKSINLAVSLPLRDVLRLFGFDVRMTRETDVSIHDPGGRTVHERKVSDMHNRLALYESADIVIAIHQNHFSVSKYNGAQVFYATSVPEGKALAASIQQRIITLLQPDNNRVIKPANNGIYLLSHTTKTAVLVECGFLSNPEECDKLNSPLYRQQLALAIADGCVNYLEKGGAGFATQNKDNL